ncbi:macrophage mannose receptor 1-like isoform X1, partial [Acipenser oxyrinchus oxyrinchus]
NQFLKVLTLLLKHFFFFVALCAVASGHFRKYHFVNDKKSWFDAQRYCREKHTDLATIESQEEADNLSNTEDTYGKTEAWIGLYRDVKQNWQWSNRDSVINNNLEAEHNIIKKSDITKKFCVEVDNHGKWTNEHCSKKNSFMCYKGKPDKSYILINQSKTWYEVQQYCRKNYIDLVSIKNNDEDKKIKEKVNGNPVWIGLFNNPWKWSHKGEYSSFHNWDKGEPNNLGNNICVEMYGAANQERGKWNDAGCHNTSPFFCYNGKDPSELSPHFYILIDQSKTWYDAQQYCRKNYTDLVSIKNNDEDKKIKEKVNGTPVWIGLFNNPWKWSHKGEYSSFHNWDKGEPNNLGNNICVEMYGAANQERGKWNDAGCHNISPFFCYNGKDPSEYILIEQLKTWYEAQQYCREHHTDLVSVKNEDENNKIKQKANGKPVWIGLFNNPWKWSDGGDNYTLQNWSEKQPDIHKGKDKCVVIQNKSNKLTLNDDPCSTAYPFFCYDGKEPCSVCVLV